MPLSDGHTGLQNLASKRVPTDRFELELGYLVVSQAQAYFVLHVYPKGGYLNSPTSGEFLELLGFQKASVECQFFHDRCYYRYVFDHPVQRHSGPFDRGVEHAHRLAQSFGEQLPQLYQAVFDIYKKLGWFRDIFPQLKQYAPLPILSFEDEAPPWMGDMKVQEHKHVEAALMQAQHRDRHFRTIEYVLWGTGEKLEEAVQYLLQDIGAQVDRTPKGATVDRLVTFPGVSPKFALEITGLNDSVKKSSPKIGQALAFKQQDEEGYKLVLVATAHNDKPTSERASLESYTSDALALLQPLEVVCMTGPQLYEVWRRVKCEGISANEFFGLLARHPGGPFQMP